MNLRTLQYYGGKNGKGSNGKFVSSNLLWEFDSSYVEPFAGMLGVLLQRRAVKCELINDTNGHIVNWWTQIRENPDEMARLIALTPDSRQNFYAAVDVIKKNSEIGTAKGAWAVYVVLTQSFVHGIGGNTWRVKTDSGGKGNWTGAEVQPLADRIKNIQIENKDALDVLELFVDTPSAMIYCDPPYPSARTDPYGEFDLDLDKMLELLKAQKGHVAVSGYGTEWDALGWNRLEHKTCFKGIGRDRSSGERTEVLWINYDADNAGKHKSLLKQ